MKETCNGEVEVVTMSFVTKLKAILLILVITNTIGIMLLMENGLTNKEYFIKFPQFRPVPKTHPGNMYSDYFTSKVTKQNVNILIIVLSAIQKYERRKVIRETWWKDCQKHEKVSNSCCLSSQPNLPCNLP